MHRLVLTLGIAMMVTSFAQAKPLSFEKDVRPLLKTHCFHCHGERGRVEGKLDLRLVRSMAGHEADSGHRVVVAGKPEESALLAVVRSGEMPKEAKKLSASEIDLLQRWIAEGAKTLRPEPESLSEYQITEEEREFWSFQPIQSTALPEPIEPAMDHPIDRFVGLALKEQGLNFANQADRRTLLRRASIDLLGLPPSPEEIAQYEADQSAQAWEKAVDRLLASPHYGERWGRHWLDVAGYAESNGAVEADSVRPHAWRYRDYVVMAHNEDKPWDEFIQEQLAGDEMAAISHGDWQKIITDTKARQRLTATGFLRMAPDPTADGPADQKLARNQVMADTLRILGSSLLGLTVHCAQCHDHRYDPVSQEDYYRLRAIFEPVFDWKGWRHPNERLYSLYTEADKAKAAEIELQAKAKEEAAAVWARAKLDEIFAKRLAAAPEALREMAKTIRATEEPKRTPEQVQFLKDHPELNVGHHPGLLNVFDGAAEQEYFKRRDESKVIRAQKPIEGFVMAATEVAGQVPETVLFNRGDHDQPKQKVQAAEMVIFQSKATPNLSEKQPSITTTGRRLAYAKWLTSGQHPMVARVLVNRFWAHHFGRGLVPSLSDFGHLGEKPSHPQLLDWLAKDFVDEGWRLKRLHKLILTSRTWQQESRNPQAEAVDADNKWLARWRPQRLDAETLRDSMLCLTSHLNPKMGGPSVAVARHASGRIVTGEEMLNANGEPVGVKSLDSEEQRRSLYVFQRRSRPLTVLETFDLPIMSPNCENRPKTTVALQSLMMLNDTFVLGQAEKLATRVAKEAPEGNWHRINRLWRLVYGQEPMPHEEARCLLFLHENHDLGSDKALASLAQVLLNTNRFLYIE